VVQIPSSVQTDLNHSSEQKLQGNSPARIRPPDDPLMTGVVSGAFSLTKQAFPIAGTNFAHSASVPVVPVDARKCTTGHQSEHNHVSRMCLGSDIFENHLIDALPPLR